MVQDRIASIQLTLLVAMTAIGTHYLAMPGFVARAAGRDGWLSLLAGAAVAGLGVWAVASISRRFPDKTVVQYNPALFGRIPGVFLNIWLLAHFTLAAAFGLRFFGDVLKLFLFDRTPLEVIMIAMLLTAAYAVRHGVNVLARLAEVFFPVVIPFWGITMFFLQMQVDYANLLPVMDQGLKPVARGIFPGYMVFQGYGLMLFITPLLQDSSQAMRAALGGIAITLFIYLVTFTGAVGIFGAQHLTLLIYPVVDLVRALTLPEMIIERQEILLLSVWILVSFLALAVAFYLVSFGASQVLGLKEFSPMVYLVLPLVYLAAILPPNAAQVIALSRMLGGSFVLLSAIYILRAGLLGLWPARRA
ncbi:MAG: hypothetical protein D9V47_07295 [Clostridia bacterium]|nr:MAG: hypothetical protein D9V47_07295 [Clostridia bacterium]